MKKIIIFYLVILISLGSLTFSFKVPKSSIPKHLGKINEQYIVASDIHLLSNNLVDKQSDKKDLTTDGRVFEYDYDIVNSFVNEVNTIKPSFVFITGDLSYNGEKDSHVELVKLLNKINNNTKVLVLPGNHDCYMINSASFKNNSLERTDNINGEEFKEIYKDYGYTGALSYDENSLSYIYELSPKRWALMLDTTTSFYNEESNRNNAWGVLFTEVMDWLEPHLQYAKEHDIEVISFMHHNLITHNQMFEDSFTIMNAQMVRDFYNQYNIKLNFSGHLHIQSIKETDGIIDIASGSLLTYGNRFGIIDIYDEYIHYHTKKITIKGMDFEQYSFNTFYEKYYNKHKPDYLAYKDKALDAMDLITKLNCYYFDGNYYAMDQLKKENAALFKQIQLKEYSLYVKEFINKTGEYLNDLYIKR